MKRIYILSVALLTVLCMHGQAHFSGSIRPVKLAGRLNVVFDFSEADIHGMTVEEFAEYEKDWKSDQAQIYSDMIEEFQKKVRAWISVGHIKHAEHTMIITVSSVSVRGDINCDANIVDTNNNHIASISNIYATGGKVGSALNLIKDGAETVGEILGAVMRKELLKVPKEKRK